MKIYEYGVIFHPDAAEKKKGTRDTLIVPVKTILAASTQAATLMAGRDIPETYLDKLDRVEVAVRPF